MLAENIQVNNSSETFKSYLQRPIQNMFCFEKVTNETVMKMIDELKPKSSYGMDRLSNKLLKYIKNDITRYNYRHFSR